MKTSDVTDCFSSINKSYSKKKKKKKINGENRLKIK